MSDDETRDSAEPRETVLERVEASPEAETEFNPFEEIAEAYQTAPGTYVRGADGMPVEVDATTESDIPALSTETLVCMGDFSKFVMRDRWGRVLAEFPPSDVVRMPDGHWTVLADCVVERMALAIEREKERARGLFGKGAVVSMSGVMIALSVDEVRDFQWIGMLIAPRDGSMIAIDGERFLVEPIRPPCRHYVRQLGSFEANAQHKATYRLCSARRTTEGTFMSLRDTGLWACDMREPYDVESTRKLDEFDVRKVSEGAKRQSLPLFQGFGGIFDAPTKSETKEN